MRPGTCVCALLVLLGAFQPAAAKHGPSALPWSAAATTSVVVEERTFTNGDVKLSGTLHLPRSQRPVAAVVVTHSASSPLRTTSLYEHLQAMLPALGIAVFVYDRRGSGQSGTQDAGGDFTLLADDAVAAVRSLKADPRIDPRRIGTWGLSQGGWISPLAASRSTDIAFVIAVSAPVVTADVQMIFSSTNHLRAHGHTQADIDRMVATRKAVDDYMRGTDESRGGTGARRCGQGPAVVQVPLHGRNRARSRDIGLAQGDRKRSAEEPGIGEGADAGPLRRR